MNFTSPELKQMPWPELQKLATQLGVNSAKKGRETLTREIVELGELPRLPLKAKQTLRKDWEIFDDEDNKLCLIYGQGKLIGPYPGVVTLNAEGNKNTIMEALERRGINYAEVHALQEAEGGEEAQAAGDEEEGSQAPEDDKVTA